MEYGEEKSLLVLFTNIYLKSTIAILLSLLSIEHGYINFESFPYFDPQEEYQMYNKIYLIFYTI